MKTVLYDEHVKLNGKMADFAGWEMPLWYAKGQSIEHHATRKNVGLFDICHMGEFYITGENSEKFVASLLTNDITGLADNQASYNFMLNEKGGVVDDCIIYKFNSKKWMLVVNAGNIKSDFEWLENHKIDGVELVDKSDQMAKLDLQGPNAPKLVKKIAGDEAVKKFKFFRFKEDVDFNGTKVLLSRTGYTGEIGFELYFDIKDTLKIWNLLLEEGAEFGIEPCGLGARDSLRTEAGLPLHGHEIHPDIPAINTPWEFVFEYEHDFIGKDAVMKAKEENELFIYPFLMDGRSKAMVGWNVIKDEKIIGKVVSGVISPSLGNKPIGFLRSSIPLELDTKLTFNQEGKKRILEGAITSSPFVAPTSRKKMKLFL